MPPSRRTPAGPGLALYALLVLGGGFLSACAEEPPLPPPTREAELLPETGIDGIERMALHGIAFTGTTVHESAEGGERRETDYVQGLQHGVRRTWNENGVQVSEYPMRRGLDHGTQREWYASGGKRSELQMDSGVAHGWQRRWDASGALTEERFCANGEGVEPPPENDEEAREILARERP